MDQEYIQQFRECLRVLEKEIFLQNTASCCNGVSLSQCHALLEIENNEKISVTELAQNMQLDKSTVSRTVDGLVKMDMVDRVIPDENRRKAILNLTEKGEKVSRTISYSNDSYVKNILQDFSDQEREVFLGLLRKLSRNMLVEREN
ncbi:MAG: MarR family transcriptional regulator [Bacteroides sp.]|nr:MarR family transcriptional regulator [Bacteroides sp.]